MKTISPNKFLSSVKVIALGFILAFGIQYLYANTWTNPPSGTPPTNCTSGYAGCDAPINVSSSNQAKPGGLAVGTASTATLATGPSLDVEGGGLYANAISTANAIVGGLNLSGSIVVGPTSGYYPAYGGNAGEPGAGGNSANGEVLTYLNGYAVWSPQSGGSATTVNSFDGGFTNVNGTYSGTNVGCTNSGDVKNLIGHFISSQSYSTDVYICYKVVTVQ